MPHGDFSDITSFFCAGLAGVILLAPRLLTKSLSVPAPIDVTVAPFFDTLPEGGDAGLQFAGSLLLFLWLVLYSNRWNTVNGKGGGLGLLAVAANCASISWKMDGGKFVPRMWHGVSIFFVLGALHLMFNANPMWTSATLAVKEKERAARKAKKN